MSQVLLMLDGNILQYTSNGETYTLQIDENLIPKRVDGASVSSNPETYAEGSTWVQGGYIGGKNSAGTPVWND